MAEKKQIWKPGNMLYPLPAVMVSCGTGRAGTISLPWPGRGRCARIRAMLYISVRPRALFLSRAAERGQFVVNLTTEELAWATDYCGVTSGRDVGQVCGLSSDQGGGGAH